MTRLSKQDFHFCRISNPKISLYCSFTELNVKEPGSLPGMSSLANSCGSPSYFEINMQIQSKAETKASLGVFLLFVVLYVKESIPIFINL